MPDSRKTKKVAGATKRSKAREVNEVLPPCAEDLVCKAVEPKNYVCTRENPSGKALFGNINVFIHCRCIKNCSYIVLSQSALCDG